MIGVVLAVLLVASGEPAEAPAALPAPEQGSISGGEALFRRGVAAYDARNYQEAITLFNAAYSVSKAPEILFDIGQAYRAMGDCRRALESFDAFVAAAPSGDQLLAKAEARQNELRSCVAVQPAAPAKGAAQPIATAVLPSAHPPKDPPRLDLRVAPAEQPSGIGRSVCAATAGSAVTLAAVGLVLGGFARSASASVEDKAVWDADAMRTDARGRAFSDAAVISLAAAGLAGAVAVGSCWWSWRTSR
jgi:tetratricopeptide (TPR) repeat protein